MAVSNLPLGHDISGSDMLRADKKWNNNPSGVGVGRQCVVVGRSWSVALMVLLCELIN